jgi:hypothetical protein
MSATDTLDVQLSTIGSTNLIYNENKDNWKFLLDSFLGGVDYKQGNYLTRYQLETNSEYAERIRSTPLQNHCKSIISVYNSFMFQDEPDREFGSLSDMPEVDAFIEDADLDGRSIDAFMKDVSTWASVFGHTWVLLSKPNIGALTRADELNAGVRPYASVLSPLSVLDWQWKRNITGYYELTMFKYIEDVNGTVQTLKEWTQDTITTWEVDFDEKKVHSEVVEVNGLGKIPAIIAYAGRSPVRGLGTSDITDIADLQKFIYNMVSEAEQTVRLDSHPSLVKTPDTQAGNGAGSLINMPENLDPGLKPYLLEYSGGSIDSIYKSVEQSTDAIDMMSNTGSVRAKTAKTLSGIAMQTEFQLLNAKLAEKADNLQLAEEQMWKLFAMYQGYVWDGVIEYPDSFNITDEAQEYQNLKTAKDTATDSAVFAVIDNKIMSMLEDDYTLANVQGLTAAQVAEYNAQVEAAEEVTPQVDPTIAVVGTSLIE